MAPFPAIALTAMPFLELTLRCTEATQPRYENALEDVGALAVTFLLDGRWWAGVVVGVVAAVFATVGDLAESSIRRDLGIKDMGHLLPGHGGIMDRLDSLLVTAPVCWALMRLFV